MDGVFGIWPIGLRMKGTIKSNWFFKPQLPPSSLLLVSPMLIDPCPSQHIYCFCYCWHWPYLNCGPLMSKAKALSTVPPPRPFLHYSCWKRNYYFVEGIFYSFQWIPNEQVSEGETQPRCFVIVQLINNKLYHFARKICYGYFMKWLALT